MKIIQEKYNFLKPYRSLNLVRMGRNEDGGYVVDNNSITLNNTLITFGMGLDWSFELDYLQKNNHGKILIYDHTVNFFTFFLPFLKSLKRFILLRKNIHDVNDRFKKLAKYLNFILSNRVSFFNKKISLNISKNTTNLNQIIKNNNIQKFILKIDIEGAEYEIIDEIIMNSNKIDMLIIEFHDIEKKKFNVSKFY